MIITLKIFTLLFQDCEYLHQKTSTKLFEISHTMAMISLCHIANVRIVEHIWRTPSIRNGLKRLFLHSWKYEYSDSFYRRTNPIFESVFSKINSITQLPDQVKMELLYAASQMGAAIINWIRDFRWESEILKEELSDEVQSDIIDNIYWTDFGSVDTNKIFRSFYSTEKMPHTMLMYVKASELCLVDCIEDLWSNRAENWANDSCRFNPIDLFSHRSALYWNDHCYGNLLKDSMPKLHEYMCQMATSKGHYSATKHFWNKLTCERRNNVVIEMAALAVETTISDLSFCNSYNELPEIVYFLIEEMTEDQKAEFFASQKNSVEYLCSLLNWPYQDLFLIAFDSLKCNLGDEYYKVVELAVGKIIKRGNCVFTVQKYAYILNEVVKIIPHGMENNKCYTVDGLPHWLYVIQHFLSTEKVESAKLIMKQYKKEIRKQVNPDNCHYLTTSESFEILRLFVDEVLESELEQRAFKSAIHTYTVHKQYAFTRYHDVGKEFLVWRFDNNPRKIENYLKKTFEGPPPLKKRSKKR